MSQDRFIQVRKFKARYCDIGQGDVPIVLVHGLIASVEYFELTISALAENHRVIALDLIGFGKSDKPDIAYDLDVFVQFLKDFLEALAIEKCVLLGHSFGGAVCLKFASLYPARIYKLILLSNAGFSRRITWKFRLLRYLPFWQYFFKRPYKKLVIGAMRSITYDPNSFSQTLLEKIFELNKPFEARRTLMRILQQSVDLFGIRRELLEFSAMDLLKLNMPILIVWGREDKILPLEAARDKIKLLPNAHLVVFERCGHVPHIEYPEKLNCLILKFIDSPFN